jgi:hypothetical protein
MLGAVAGQVFPHQGHLRGDFSEKIWTSSEKWERKMGFD